MSAETSFPADSGDPPLPAATEYSGASDETGVEAMVERATARWRAGLVELAGGSSLADIGLLGDAVVDLTAAHPSGIAQLFAGRPTRLSNLFREGTALTAARRRARAVIIGVAEHSQRYGVAPTYLAIGVATWAREPEVDPLDAEMSALTGAIPLDEGAPGTDAGPPPVVQAPVLLRPITITARDDGETDYDLTLEPATEINPLLVRTLRTHGAILDSAELARSTFTGSGFDPAEALHRVDALGRSALGDFELTHRVIAGAFVHPGQVLVDDLDELGPRLHEHEVIASLAGGPPAVPPPLPTPRVGDADPVHERGVGDLDPSQRYVIDVLATGSHVFVDAPAGSDVAGTLAAVVAEAAASGRTVLYVPGHRRTADALIARLDLLGLGGLVLDVAPAPTWRQTASHRLLSAMAVEAEQVDQDAVAKTLDALLRARGHLSGYIEALHLIREPWGASAYDALQALARLTADRPAPSTHVRLPEEVVLATLGPARDKVAEDLARAADLGAFTHRAASSPWHDADITSDDTAADAIVRIERLRDHTLPQMRGHVVEVATTTGLTPASTVRQWGEQLTMLGGMRGTLDLFQPMVFETSAQAMVEATATKKWRIDHDVDMSALLRRRLQRQARDMLRPGVRVPDLHAALLEVQAQRAVWQAECPRGGWPVLPEGLARIEDTYEAVRIDLERLDPVLPGGAASLLDLPFDALRDRLAGLARARDDLTDLPARTVLHRELVAVGLGELVADLAAREVGKDLVVPEFELAWWGSVFEQILATEPTLQEEDSAGLEALARRFRALDRKHIESLAAPVRIAAREHLAVAMREHPEQTDALFTELIEGRLTSLRDVAERYAAVHARLRPVLVATPTLVPHVVPPDRVVDLVVVDAIEHAPIELLVSSLARGRQILVVGDHRVASRDAIGELTPLLPTVTLAAEGSRRDPAITEFLAEHGYAGVLRPAPMPRPEQLIHFDLVEGVGMPDPVTGAVESSQAEVERVVDLAIDHAVSRPEESFAIVTASTVHAERLRDALHLEVRRNPALAGFFAGSRPEPVVVADLAGTAGLTRDAVVFSVGYGRTPHGRVLHRFGMLGEPGGDAVLLDAVGAARRRLSVVSSFSAGDLDPERLRGRGPRVLAQLLGLAERRHGAVEEFVLGNGVDVGGSPDRLLLDLAERLWKTGLVVETMFGIGDGDRIPLAVGHPDLPGELLVAVLTDDDAYVAERSIRVRDRQLAERLERLGWVVTQVWSAAVFLDPAKETDRVRQIVQQVRDLRVGASASRDTAQLMLPLVDEE